MTNSTAVLLPVRSFRDGMTRLGGVVDGAGRYALGRRCAERVRRASGRLPVVVMSDDPEVRSWAVACGAAGTLGDCGWDLNTSVAAAVASLRESGTRRVVVAHGDLPLADDLSWVARHRGVVIVPDRRDDGTNVLAVPTDAGFRFSYGRASSHHHDGEALRLGLDVTVVRDPLLAWDLDIPEDLRLPTGCQLEELRAASLRVRESAGARSALRPASALDGARPALRPAADEARPALRPASALDGATSTSE